MAADVPGGERPRRRARWPFVALACVAAFVAWHAIFDYHVSRGIRAYVDGHARYEAGNGPAVSVRATMDAAVRRGVWWGLAGAGAVLGLSAGAYTITRARRSRDRRS